MNVSLRHKIERSKRPDGHLGRWHSQFGNASSVKKETAKLLDLSWGTGFDFLANESETQHAIHELTNASWHFRSVLGLRAKVSIKAHIGNTGKTVARVLCKKGLPLCVSRGVGTPTGTSKLLMGGAGKPLGDGGAGPNEPPENSLVQRTDSKAQLRHGSCKITRFHGPKVDRASTFFHEFPM